MPKLIFTSYSGAPEFTDPYKWLNRIEAYTGILEKLAADHEVISIEHISYNGRLQQNGVQYLFTRLKGKTTRFPFKIHRLIKDLQPDFVFINGLIFPLQVIQLKLTLGKRTKIILLHRAEKPFGGIKKLFQKMADRYIEAYLFASPGFGEKWKGNIDKNKIYEVIQASSVFQVTDKAMARNITKVSGHPVFLWVGGLTVNKDPVTVVKAFLDFAARHQKARLYMIFQTEELLPVISKLILDHAMGGNVFLKGLVPHNALTDWFNSADFYISASHYEGSGVALSEAMSCGCIPITTDITSFQKMKGHCGYGFKAGDDRELLSILEKSLHTDLENEREKVLRQFKDELSFEAIVRKINLILRKDEVVVNP